MVHVVCRGGRARKQQAIAEQVTSRGGAYFDSVNLTNGSPLFGKKQTLGIRDKHISGYITIDGKEVASCVQCVHCGGHYIPRPGSGIKRGYCLNCQGPLCGGPRCRECIPFQKKLEMQAKGIPVII
jgi:hypothetical protein